MPTYEFRCPRGHEFEKFYRSIAGAEGEAACPLCGLPAERVMSAAGFAFKGSGFYLTDYGKNAHRDKGTPEPKSGAPAGEGGSSSDGAAPSSKPEPAPSDGGSKGSGEQKKGEAKSESKSGSESKSKSESVAKPESKADAKPAAAPAKKSSSE
jgi:putative FmdB family regulatory protein